MRVFDEKSETIEDYMKECEIDTVEPLFKKPVHLRILWYEGYIRPKYSTIQIIHGWGPQEDYRVIDQFLVRGLHNPYKDLHNISELLNDDVPYWSIGNPNNPPRLRESK